MEFLKYCAIAILCALLILIVRQWKSDLTVLIRLGCVLLFGSAAIASAAPLINYLRALMGMNGTSAYTEILFKALGIATLAQICASICRECGESAAANGVELIGRIELLLLALPLIQEILTVAQELLTLGGGS